MTEDRSYKGYKLHWVTDENEDGHIEVYKGNKFMASYTSEDEACKSIDSGEVEEEVNSGAITTRVDQGKIEDSLTEDCLYVKDGKFTHTYSEGAKVYEALEDIDEEVNPFKDLKKLPRGSSVSPGLYTDTKGGVYKAPTKGLSKKYRFSGYEFAYDFGKSELVGYCDSKEVLRTTLSLADWLDDPQYWMKDSYSSLKEIEGYLHQHPEKDKSNVSVKEIEDALKW